MTITTYAHTPRQAHSTQNLGADKTQNNKSKLELLAPAGGMDQLRYAVYYGANAVYLGVDQFGLRARASNFTLDEIPEAVRFAHDHGVAVHVTCNALMQHQDLQELPSYLEALDAAGVDAIIVSDLGALSLVKKHAPSVDIHISTQASCANAESARVFYELGAKRIVCAREMSLEEISSMRSQIPADLELEVFVHGAMCMAVSGRCLISDYVTGRSANKGNCSQPCRWKYQLVEEHRPDTPFSIEEDEGGSYIMNAQDMNMLAHLDAIAAAGVNSIKIEGRNKKAFYVATVVNAYRQVLDGASLEDFSGELDKISHRPYSTGFYFGKATQASNQDGYLQEYVHVATVEESYNNKHKNEDVPEGSWQSLVHEDEGYSVKIRCHNRMIPGDTIEIVSPHAPVRSVQVENILWRTPSDTWISTDAANRAMESYIIQVPFECHAHDLIRRKLNES